MQGNVGLCLRHHYGLDWMDSHEMLYRTVCPDCGGPIATIRYKTITYGKDIDVAQRVISNDQGDPLTFLFHHQVGILNVKYYGF